MRIRIRTHDKKFNDMQLSDSLKLNYLIVAVTKASYTDTNQVNVLYGSVYTR